MSIYYCGDQSTDDANEKTGRRANGGRVVCPWTLDEIIGEWAEANEVLVSDMTAICGSN